MCMTQPDNQLTRPSYHQMTRVEGTLVLNIFLLMYTHLTVVQRSPFELAPERKYTWAFYQEVFIPSMWLYTSQCTNKKFYRFPTALRNMTFFHSVTMCSSAKNITLNSKQTGFVLCLCGSWNGLNLRRISCYKFTVDYCSERFKPCRVIQQFHTQSVYSK